MPHIRLRADDGETLLGQVPDSWAQVPLAAYATLVGAESLPARIEALAALVGLPPAPLLDTPELAGQVLALAPWLFAGPLPEATEPVPSFTHLGTTYTYCGGVGRATAEQLEALLAFQQEHYAHPIGGGPHLLAVLYQVAGQPQTPESVLAASQALASLPVSIAYPALQDFIRRSAPWAQATQRYLAARAAAGQTLSALEAALTTSPTSALPGRSWSMRRWLGKAWIRHARKLLKTSSPPSAFTAGSMPPKPSSRPVAPITEPATGPASTTTNA
jgi:hypothetical protein